MMKSTTVFRTRLGSGGRLMLPAEVLGSTRLEKVSDFEIEIVFDGVLLRPCPPMTASEVIEARFKAYFEPLAVAGSEPQTKKVSRWTYKGRESVVTENGRPNIWMRKELSDKFDSVPPCLPEFFEPNPEGNPGFHSNVHSTPGLKGQALAKYRATDPGLAADLADYLFEQLEKNS